MPEAKQIMGKSVSAVDLFCGAGGLTHGLLGAGIQVPAGYDIEECCRFPYEHNNKPAKFFCDDISHLSGRQLAKHYPKNSIRVLVGCAPCQTFSKYTQGVDHSADPKWSLLDHFARLIRELKPEIVSMENVPELQRHDIFEDFMDMLKTEKYFFEQDTSKQVIYCPDYGVPQKRKRLVVLASKLGPIKLINKTHTACRQRTVRDALGSLPKIDAGETHMHDPMHRASSLSPLNTQRIRHSIPGGTWRDWPKKLVADCHNVESGRAYASVYGRMVWDEPSPTITTQFYGYGNGRFGHPEQTRGLSLREGAILQSFPKKYAFVAPGQPYSINAIGKMIGNAVPVRVGKVIGMSILKHLENHGH